MVGWIGVGWSEVGWTRVGWTGLKWVAVGAVLDWTVFEDECGP